MSESDAPITEPSAVSAAHGDAPAASFEKPPAAPAAPATSLTSPLTLGGVLAGVLVIVGSIGPWATAGPLSVAGLKGDGVITLVLAIIILLAVVARRFARTAVVFALLSAAVSIYDTVNINSIADDFIKTSVGWGVVLAAVGSIGLVVWSVLASVQAQQAKKSIA